MFHQKTDIKYVENRHQEERHQWQGQNMRQIVLV